MIRKTLFVIILNLFALSLFSQNNCPPSPLELFMGNNKSSLQLNLRKPIYNSFYFQTVNYATADYKNTAKENELVSNNSVLYQFHKNINVGAGVQYHYIKGIIPNISMSLDFVNPTWLLVLSPNFQFMPTYNIETRGMIEFKPLLTNNIRLYTHASALYNHNFTDKYYERGYASFRLGLKIDKISFGVGSRFDYYGAKKLNKNNYGVFFKYDF